MPAKVINVSKISEPESHLFVGFDPRKPNGYSEIERIFANVFVDLDHDLAYSCYQSRFEKLLNIDTVRNLLESDIFKNVVFGCTCSPYKCHATIIVDYINNFNFKPEEVSHGQLPAL